MNYADYKERQGLDVKSKCRLREMMAYGLNGYAKSLGEKNEVCPNI